jgi:hypothetical protein
MRITPLAGALALASALAACGEDQTAQNDQGGASNPVPPPSERAVAPGTTGSTGLSPNAAGGDAFREAVGRSFSGGPITLRLGADQRFTMRGESGRAVTGRYAQADGVLTLDEAQGDTMGARFPMSCRFEPQANGAFRLADVDGSCPHFGAVTFTPEG